MASAARGGKAFPQKFAEKTLGKAEHAIPRHAGFLPNYSFVCDHVGTRYWVERGDTTIIRKRTPEGTITTLCATTGLRDVRWMTARAIGTIYLSDGDELRCVTTKGLRRATARDLKERRFFEFVFGDPHNLMSFWLDA